MDPEHIRPVPARAGSDQDCRVCMRCCWHPTDPATNVLSWQFFGGKILGGFSFGFLIDIVDMRICIDDVSSNEYVYDTKHKLQFFIRDPAVFNLECLKNQHCFGHDQTYTGESELL